MRGDVMGRRKKGKIRFMYTPVLPYAPASCSLGGSISFAENV